MIWPWVLGGIAAALILLYLFLTYTPSSKHIQTAAIFGQGYFAHRGFHSKTDPENSLAAFENACHKGFGIEFDVQLSSDGVPVVFHDATLERMCGMAGNVKDHSARALGGINLLQTQQCIPTLDETLALISGRAPLIVELKHYMSAKEIPAFCEKVALMLDDYPGVFCIESFHPLVVGWFAKNRPAVLRGQLASGMKDAAPSPLAFALSRLLLNALSRPHFIAYRHQDMKLWRFRLIRALYRPLILGWTVRSAAEEKACAPFTAAFIFENYLPDQVAADHQ